MAPIELRYYCGWMYEWPNSHLGFGVLRFQIQKKEMCLESFRCHEQTSQQIARRRRIYSHFVLECRIQYFGITSKSSRRFEMDAKKCLGKYNSSLTCFDQNEQNWPFPVFSRKCLSKNE